MYPHPLCLPRWCMVQTYTKLRANDGKQCSLYLSRSLTGVIHYCFLSSVTSPRPSKTDLLWRFSDLSLRHLVRARRPCGLASSSKQMTFDVADAAISKADDTLTKSQLVSVESTSITHYLLDKLVLISSCCCVGKPYWGVFGTFLDVPVHWPLHPQACWFGDSQGVWLFKFSCYTVEVANER